MKTIAISNSSVAFNVNTNANTWDEFLKELVNKEIAFCGLPLVSYVVSYNDMDADLLKDSAAELPVEDGDKFEFNDNVILNEPKKEEAPVEEAPTTFGMVAVFIAGGINSKNISIKEHTEVKDLITKTLADFFAKTEEELKNMKVDVNDEEADMDTELRDGDNVTFQSRKAGVKGCLCSRERCNKDAETHTVNVSIENVGDYSYVFPVDFKLEEVIEAVAADMMFDDGEQIDPDDLALVKINGEDVPRAFEAQIIAGTELTYVDTMVLKLDVPDANIDGRAYGFASDFEDNSEVSEDDEEDFDDEDEIEEEVDAYFHDAPVVPKVGTIVVSIGGGVQTVEVPVVFGKTTVEQVVTGKKVLAMNNMDESDLSKLVFQIDDEEVGMNTVLQEGDKEITMTPRKAGVKGC
jgi:molybdopterin converting factor small subunit